MNSNEAMPNMSQPMDMDIDQPHGPHPHASQHDQNQDQGLGLGHGHGPGQAHDQDQDHSIDFDLSPIDPDPLATSADAFLLKLADGIDAGNQDSAPQELNDFVSQCGTDFVNTYLAPSVTGEPEHLGRLIDRLNTHFLPMSDPLIQSKLNGQHIQLSRSPLLLIEAVFCVLRGMFDFDRRPAYNQILKVCCDQFTSATANEALVSELARSLTRHIDLCDGHSRRIMASTLTGYLIRPIRYRSFLHHAAFDVLGHELDFLIAIDKDEATPGVSGRTSFNNALAYLLEHAPWNQKHTIPLIKMCKDLGLAQDQLKRLVEVIATQLLPSPDVDDTDLPILIFNLLSVSSQLKSSPDKRAVFAAISKHMTAKANAALGVDCPETERTKRIADQSSLEATILMHFRLALNNDADLPNDFIAYEMALKRQYLTPFDILMILMFCDNKPNHPLLNHVRKELGALVKIEAESERLKWLQGFSPFEIPTPQSILQTVVQRTVNNWHVLESLIDLGCMLINKHDPKPAHVPTSSIPSAKLPYMIAGLSFSPADVTLGLAPMSARGPAAAADTSATTSALGQSILVDVYTHHSVVRTMILDRIRTLLSPSIPSSAGYMSVLDRILATPALAGDLVREHAPHVRHLLLLASTSLAGPLGLRMLTALLPLTRTDPALRTSVMLMLRKGTLSAQSIARELSAVGCVRYLGVVTAAPSTAPEGFHPDVQMEVVGVARRAAGLDAELRRVYYQLLVAQMTGGEAGARARLARLVLPTLQAHLEPLLDRTNGFLVKFDKCVDSVEIVEPMHWLIKCVTVAVAQCMAAAEQDAGEAVGRVDEVEKRIREEATRAVEKAKTQLRQCAEKMRSMDLSDYGISATAVFSFNEEEEARVYVLGNLIAATYETVLEFIAVTRTPPTTASGAGAASSSTRGPSSTGRATDDQLLEALYNRGREATDAIRSRYVDTKGKKKPTQPLHCDACLMDPSTLYALQDTLNMPDHQLMAKLSSAVYLSSAQAQQQSLVALAKVFLAQLVPANVAAVASRTKDNKGKTRQSLAMFAVESLETVVQRVLMYDDYEDKLDAMVRNDEAGGASAGAAAGMVDEGLSLVQVLMQSVDALINAEYDAEAARLIGVLDMLLPSLPDTEAETLYGCVLELLMGGTTLADAGVLRALLALMVRIKWDDIDALESTLQTISLHVLHDLGHLQEVATHAKNEYCPHPSAVDLAEDGHFNVDLRGPKTRVAFVKVVLEFVGDLLADLDWTFKEYKIEFGKKGMAPSLERRSAFENRVAARLHAALVPMYTLSVIALPYSLAEAMYRSLIHLFGTTITYLQLKRSMDTMPDDACVQVIRRASAVRHWLHQLTVHFDKQAVVAATDVKEKEEAKKTKAAAKGKGKAKAGAGKAAGKTGKGKKVDSDDEDDDELMDELDLDDRSATSGTTLAGGENMTPAQKAQAKMVKRQRALGKLAAELVEKGEMFDVQLIALANVYKSLTKFLRRSAIHDVKLPAAGRGATRAAPEVDDELGEEDGPSAAKRSRKS